MYTKYKVNLVVQISLGIKERVQLGLSQNNAPWPMGSSWVTHVEKSCLLCQTQGQHITFANLYRFNRLYLALKYKTAEN